MKLSKHELISKKTLDAYDRYYNAIFKYCLYRVHNRDDALDVVQEVFIRFFNYLHTRHIRYVQSFLYRTATNIIIDRSRKQKDISLDSLEENYFPHVSYVSGVEHVVDAGLLLNQIDKLEFDYKQVLLMRFVDDLNPREIARKLGESPNVISVRIHRGIRKLKAQMGNMA